MTEISFLLAILASWRAPLPGMERAYSVRLPSPSHRSRFTTDNGASSLYVAETNSWMVIEKRSWCYGKYK